MNQRKTLFITISRGSLIRNLFHTGVVARLIDAGVRVVVLTPYQDAPELFKEFKHENLYIEPLFLSQGEKLRGFLKELCKGVVFNTTVYARYRYSIGTHQEPSRLLFPFRLFFFAPLRYIPGARTGIRLLHSFINPLAAHDYLFEKYKPTLVFNTAAGADCGVLKSAKRFGVPTVDMPKSWDNVSQALFPTKADFLVVWNDFMKRKRLEFKGYTDDEIIVTGIPQFDFYVKKDGLLSREAFCAKHGFDPKKKIILYGSAGAELFDETKHVLLIHEFMKQRKLPRANILVRPHFGYPGDVERFSILEQYDGIVVDKSDKQNHALRDHFDTSKEHVYNLFNSLYHADVCVNVASTLSLDAVACGTEVLNFDFDAEQAGNPNTSVGRLFVSDYVRNLMDSGGTWLAKNKEDFLEFLCAILEEGKKKPKEKLIEDFLYKNDGESAERLAWALLKILDSK